MFDAIDAFLGMPTALIVVSVLLLWALIAYSIHRFVVPLLCGADGRKLGKFEAEVTSQIALAFGLLISFNAVWLWDRADRVRGAVFDEAAALSRVVDDAEDLAADGQPELVARRDAICRGVKTYVDFLIEKEWPTLSDSSTDRARPEALTELRAILRASGDDAMRESLANAETARDIRIREGLEHMPMSRWGVVFLLAILLLISIGALHGEAPRGRKLALTLVGLAVAFCFAVLFVNARPFVGAYALQPDELRKVAFRAAAEH
jgi:Protein of unknown function (DUF4239)